ncbi:iron-hydroxamate ABC transporter substrate-binding protein [Brevibacillus borstelensis]|uniref:iron-hydroxamate ABC transporter substrate-binding protein n=1 Tax=Brevibacillus borstelensis TaxID=45462 RepID=UPI0030BC377F
MKKFLFPFLLLFVLIISACNGQPTVQKVNASPAETASETIAYQSENGPIQVPAHPQRVIVLSNFTGHVLSLGVNIVGTDSWAKQNPRFEEKLKDAQEVSDETLEKIIELQPDLIIGMSNINNVDKLGKIAPTVTYTYGKLDYLTQYLEIGKLLNKEKEAQAWIDDFKKRAQQAGQEIRAKIGEDKTVSVLENFDKQLYVFGDNWGRGTEILYREMKLKMPEKIKETALKSGYYAVSLEVLPQFVGDYLIFSKNKDVDHSFENTDTYKNIPAVKNSRVFEAASKEFYFNDPLTLEFQLEFFTNSFLGR